MTGTPTYRLLTRADDAGLVASANGAIRDCVVDGLARNVGVMAPAPALEDAADRLVGLDCSIGCHVTLTAEWEQPRWGSVLPPGRVPTLVGADGTFPYTAGTVADRARPADARAEAAAQLERLRSAGFEVDYLDTHMRVSDTQGIDDALAALCADEDLVYADRSVPVARLEGDGSPAERVATTLDGLSPGGYAVVAHPCYDRPDARDLRAPDGEPGAVAADRDRQRRLFADQNGTVRAVLDRYDAVLGRYDEV